MWSSANHLAINHIFTGKVSSFTSGDLGTFSQGPGLPIHYIELGAETQLEPERIHDHVF